MQMMVGGKVVCWTHFRCLTSTHSCQLLIPLESRLVTHALVELMLMAPLRLQLAPLTLLLELLIGLLELLVVLLERQMLRH